MNLQPYPEKDGMKVWLDRREVRQFIEQADGPQHRIAFLLGVRSGLRVSEIVEVSPEDVRRTRAGPRVRIWESKGKEYRETPAPTELVRAVEYYDPDSDTLVDRSARTVGRWVKRAGQDLTDATGDRGWTYLTPHDLRGTWATLLAAEDVNAMLVCDWGGWDDLETFLEHYRGTYSPEVQREQLANVEWLDNGEETGHDVEEDPHVRLPEVPGGADA